MDKELHRLTTQALELEVTCFGHVKRTATAHPHTKGGPKTFERLKKGTLI